MKKRYYKPVEPVVVLDKGRRGGEVQAVQVMDMNGIYYKSYDSEGVPVLVTEKSLEQMRNLVNLKIRPRGKSAFTKTPDEKTEKDEFKKYIDRLGKLALKLEEFKRDDTSKYKAHDKNYRSPEREALDKNYRSTEHEAFGNNYISPEHLLPIRSTDPKLGKWSFFERLIGRQSNKDTVLISGKFYNKNILEEEKSIPKYLTIENRNVQIDSKSIIFEEGVTHDLSTNDIRVIVKGEFVKSKTAPVYTPSLVIDVERCSTCENNSKPSELSRNTLESPTGVFGHRALTHTIKTRGFTPSPTRTERGETIYESSPFRTTEPDYSMDKSITKDVTVYECYTKTIRGKPRFAVSPNTAQEKTEYGDEVENCDSAENIDICMFNKEEKTVYECGRF